MPEKIGIGLVGDYSASVPAHQAIPVALQMASQQLNIHVNYQWLATEAVTNLARVASFDGLWCVPASPYRSMEGALLAIRYARQNQIPFLGTCGGFQHAVIEYARNVLGWGDAGHAESSPDAARAVIAPLLCGLLESAGRVHLLAGTRIAAAYGATTISEEYLCRYGVNPEFRSALLAGPLRECAHDDTGDIRAVELDDHPFFIATLFQPERAALKGRPAPLVTAFVSACASH